MNLVRGHEEPRKGPEQRVTGFHLGMKTTKTLPAIEDTSGFINLSSDPQLETARPVGTAGALRVQVRALHDPAFSYKASPSHVATWLTTRRAPDTPQSPDPPQDRVLLLQAGAGPEIPPHPVSPGGLLHVPNAHRHPQAGPALPPRAIRGPAWPPEHGSLPQPPVHTSVSLPAYLYVHLSVRARLPLPAPHPRPEAYQAQLCRSLEPWSRRNHQRPSCPDCSPNVQMQEENSGAGLPPLLGLWWTPSPIGGESVCLQVS